MHNVVSPGSSKASPEPEAQKESAFSTSQVAKKVIAFEIDPRMCNELHKRVQGAWALPAVTLASCWVAKVRGTWVTLMGRNRRVGLL